jgi:hypothetical protein
MSSRDFENSQHKHSTKMYNVKSAMEHVGTNFRRPKYQNIE